MILNDVKVNFKSILNNWFENEDKINQLRKESQRFRELESQLEMAKSSDDYDRVNDLVQYMVTEFKVVMSKI
tara:strand:+ start:1731 stop:1946 length:216 start_codon:yes stop_codon:yes gene_type:complete